MKSFFRLLAGWLVLLGTASGQETLNWERCVKLATLNNPDVAASRESVRSYEARHGGSYSAFYPQITATMGATYNHSSGGSQTTGTGSFGGNTAALHQYSAGVTISQTIYDGGLTAGNVAQAAANYRAQVAALALEKSLISYDLKSAFAQLLYSQELVALTSKIADRRRSDADLIHLKYEGGRENKGAYLLSESDYQQALLDFHNAQRNVTVSRQQLSQILGVKLAQSLAAAGTLAAGKPSASPDFDKLAAETPAHFQQVSNTEASRAGIAIARSGNLPTITASAALERQDQRFFPQAGGWSAGFTVSLPIFDGGKTYFNVKAADAALRQSLAVLRSSDNSALYTLVQTHSALMSAIEAVGVNQATVAAQKVRSEIGEGQYSDGLISFTDFNLIENDLVTAEKQELQSRRDAVIAEANWEYAQGKGAIP